MASAKVAHEPPSATLQATALVHEAWLRLGGDDQQQWRNRAHFFGAAAEAMRRILIDRARRRMSVRHGGRLERLDIDDLNIPEPATQDDDLLAIHEALDRLAVENSEKAELVKLRYFVGMTLEEAADVLGVAPRTAKRWWSYARAWLKIETRR